MRYILVMPVGLETEGWMELVENIEGVQVVEKWKLLESMAIETDIPYEELTKVLPQELRISENKTGYTL